MSFDDTFLLRKIPDYLKISFAIIALLYLSTGCKREKEVEVELISAGNISDILPVNDSLVVPVDYNKIVSLDSLDIDHRKQFFIDVILPPVLIVEFNLNKTYDRVNDFSTVDSSDLSRDDKHFLDTLLVKYKAENIEELKIRLRTHPVSIVIAQAALECAWGTSRFFYEANNPFGIWSFFSDEQRVESNFSRNGNQVYLKKFNSFTEAVENYFFLIATGPYSKFRNKRLHNSDPEVLVPYLYNYSEMRSVYVDLVLDIIRQNDLTRYDNFQIDPEYID